MIYIYVFEDGSVKWSNEGPCQGDLSCIGDGLLSVFRCSAGTEGLTLEECNENEIWSPAQKAEYNQICGQEFHE